MVSTAVAVRVRHEDGPLATERVPVTSPAARHVRVSVAASGVCHADIATSRARGATAPVTPGHEVAGVVAEVGERVQRWRVGDRVAVGWFGGSCGMCDACRRGDVVHCPERQVPGQSYPGGWAESITVPDAALASIPDGMGFAAAAPMGCAGVTTFNALRLARARAGGRVAVVGVGGLGHLAVQFAAAMGYEVVAVARGPERESLARDLGAHRYLDSSAERPGAALARLGGADLILSTVPSTGAVEELLDGLAVGGRLTLIGVDGGSIRVPAARLVMSAQTLTGHLTGSPVDTEEAMRFAVTNGVRPHVEMLPLERAGEAVERLAAGRARFRIVLDATADRVEASR